MLLLSQYGNIFILLIRIRQLKLTNSPSSFVSTYCRTGRVVFYSRTYTNQHRTVGSNITATGTEGAEGVLHVPISDNSPSSNHIPILGDTS